MKTKVQQPFYKSKLALALFMVLAIVAIVSPFWLFTSNDTITFGSSQEAKDKTQTQDNEVIKYEENANGKTGTLVVEEVKKDAKNSSDESSKNATPNSKQEAKSSAKADDKAKVSESTKANDKAEAKKEAKDANASAAAAAAKTDAKSTNSKDDKSAAKANEKAEAKADAKSEAKTAEKKETDKATNAAKAANDSDKDKSAANNAKGETAKNDAGKSAADKILAGETVKDDKNNVTAAVSSAMVSDEAVGDSGNKDGAAVGLAQKVAEIEKNKTKEQREAYAQSIAARKAQVDAAVSSIAKSSRIYMPPMLGSRALVVYFAVQTTHSIEGVNSSHLSKLKPKDIDGMTGATTLNDKNKVNGVQYIAKLISEKTGAQLYNITTVVNYPSNIQKLYDFAFKEMAVKARPELTDDNPLNLKEYDAIYICYPNWWDDMPSAVYSFFDKYDLSNMTIVPVIVHSGDGAGNTVNAIDTLEPNATVYDTPLEISRNEMKEEDVDLTVSDYLTKLSQDFN